MKNYDAIALLVWFILTSVYANIRNLVLTKQAGRDCLKNGSRPAYKQTKKVAQSGCNLILMPFVQC